MEKTLPAIPAKRYFTIGEVSELCGVKPYVRRFWEQEFTLLKPMKRRGNRRYYQHHEVLLIRRIRELLYDQGFTISGARSRLTGAAAGRASGATAGSDEATGSTVDNAPGGAVQGASEHATLERGADACTFDLDKFSVAAMRQELLLIRELLSA